MSGAARQAVEARQVARLGLQRGTGKVQRHRAGGRRRAACSARQQQAQRASGPTQTPLRPRLQQRQVAHDGGPTPPPARPPTHPRPALPHAHLQQRQVAHDGEVARVHAQRVLVALDRLVVLAVAAVQQAAGRQGGAWGGAGAKVSTAQQARRPRRTRGCCGTAGCGGRGTAVRRRRRAVGCSDEPPRQQLQPARPLRAHSHACCARHRSCRPCSCNPAIQAGRPAGVQLCRGAVGRAVGRAGSPIDVPAHVGAQVGLDAALHQVVRLRLALQAVEQQALRKAVMVQRVRCGCGASRQGTAIPGGACMRLGACAGHAHSAPAPEATPCAPMQRHAARRVAAFTRPPLRRSSRAGRGAAAPSWPASRRAPGTS